MLTFIPALSNQQISSQFSNDKESVSYKGFTLFSTICWSCHPERRRSILE